MTCACGGTTDPFGIAGLDACNCCTGTGPQTPETVTNRPAMGRIGYRAGRYATFRASMLAALSSANPELAPLGALRTRDPGDFSIGLLGSWATVLDILTFYSERLANEAFLRTAVEQRSVTELAALVGYTPSPGVAASATLAFTLSTAPGSPASVLIPAGTRVQSIPGPGQTAQVFETSADLTALAAWNALPAQTTVPWLLPKSGQNTWITGTANNVNVGDALLFAAAPGGALSSTGPAEFHYVTAVQPDPVAKATQLSWDTPLTTDFTDGAALYVFRKKAALYGANAPNPQTLSGPYVYEVPGWPGEKPKHHKHPKSQYWDYLPNSSQVILDSVILDSVVPGLVPQKDAPQPWLVLTRTEGAQTYTVIAQITDAHDSTPGYYTLTSKVTTVTLTLVTYLINGAPDTAKPPLSINTLLHQFIPHTPEVTVHTGSAQLSGAPLPLTDWSAIDQLLLASKPPGMLPPVAGTTFNITGGQQVPAGQAAGVSGKRVRLQTAVPPTGTPGATFMPTGSSGGSVADGQVFLIDAFPPVVDAAGDTFWSVITLSGFTGTLSIPLADQLPWLLPADKADPVTGETVVIQGVAPTGDLTQLTLAAPLSRIYDTGTVMVNANAVLATNGETTQEILGSGEATNPGLSFTLKQAPLTYVTAPVASGAQSTLQVWVNNLRWQEVPNLLPAGPADRVYTTSVNAAGNTVVRLGDGTHGGRPPTGQANIRAVYRKGIGMAGMVAAGQVSQPLDRPQGVTGVSNPDAATGAADPATTDEIRTSAPLPTLTISRVVSLADYQDYALGFAGIAKALATWTWSGDLRGVFLTVVGATGATLAADDPVVSSLEAALRQSGDPHVPLAIVPGRVVLFTFTASIAMDTTTYNPSLVLAQVWQAVSDAFAFGRRSLGQGVAASEIIEVIQGVPGVVAVRLTGLERSGQPGTGGSVLRASGPQPPSGTQSALGAELLLLDPATHGQLGSWS